MKLIIERLFWFFCLSLFFKFSAAQYLCGTYKDQENLFCIKNQDNGTLNVIYDCNENKIKRANIWLWSSKFPEEIDALIIQNCEDLSIYGGVYLEPLSIHFAYIKDPLKLNFSRLKVVNISNFDIKDEKPEDWLNHVKKSYEYEKSSSKIELSLRPSDCLLKNVIFENIDTAKLYHNFPPPCAIKVLKLVNVTNLITYDSFPKTDNSTIEITSSRLNYRDYLGYKRAFTINNAYQVIMSKNYFEFRSWYDKIIQLKIQKIVLTENEFGFLPRASLLFIGENIQITNNIFHHIDEGAFEKINAMKDHSKLNISTSYNFSNNVIYSLTKGALNINLQQSRLNFFDNVIIANNSINCDCANSYWFHSIFPESNDPQKNRFYKKWSDENNQNKCLNIPNCSIGQVLKNYVKLCEKDYDHECPMPPKNNTAGSNIGYDEDQFISLNSNSFNSGMSQNISNLLQVLVDKIEKSPSKNINTGNEELYDRLNIIDSHLLVIIILFCFLIIYVSVIICFKSSFIRVLILKFVSKPKPLFNETEMS